MSDSFSGSINDAIREAMRSVQDALGEASISDDLDPEPGQDLDRVFQVGPNPELRLANVSGEIQVRGADVDTITVRATKRGSPSRAANTEVTFDQEANRVSVSARGSMGGALLLGRNVGRVDYNAVVPRSCVLRVHTVSGEVSIRDIVGPVVVESVSGDIALRLITGQVTLTTVSGDVSMEDLEGGLVLRTTSGDIEVSRSSISHFNLNSVSGDLTIETPLVVGQHYLAKTVSGDLHLRVPPSSGATIVLKTTSGDIDIRLPAEIIRSGRRHWQGRINGGGATIEMTSVSGDLTVAPGKGVAPSQPQASHASADPAPEVSTSVPEDAVGQVSSIAVTEGGPEAEPPEDTSTILRLLEQGEITVDEAMQRLDKLSQS